MSKYKLCFKYGSYALVPMVWYYLGTHDRELVKANMFNRGFNLSQRFKKYPFWDHAVEPLIVKQSSILFAAGNSFIKGMISDNDNSNELKDSLAIYKQEIEKELKELDKKN